LVGGGILELEDVVTDLAVGERVGPFEADCGAVDEVCEGRMDDEGLGRADGCVLERSG